MPNPVSPLVLASASPRRRQILTELGVPFVVEPADIDEIREPGEEPAVFARRAAFEKAAHVASRLAKRDEHPFVLGADTIVVIDEDVLGKPRDDDDARAMLGRLAGREHVVITGWAVGRDGGPWHVEHTATAVRFHRLTGLEIEAFVRSGEGRDKAGAYAIQGLGSFLVERVEGNYLNVVGLPASLVVRVLVEVGALPCFPPA